MSFKAPVSKTHVDVREAVPAASDTGLESDPINILLVDDEPKNLVVLETVLAHPSYRLVKAESGEEALLALIDSEFALLILDIQMPGMTGFELAKMIKSRKRTAHVPIIFLTAYYNEDEHVLEGYDSGAVDYLYKPVNPTMLRSKVSVFADLHRKNQACATANTVLTKEVEHRRHVEEQLRELNQHLEHRVAERTRELREHAMRLYRANEALEQFAFAASHDLQEPLRNIAIYSELFKSRYAANLSGEAKMFLETIMEGAQRMTTLVTDLLEYAQIDRPGDPPAVADGEDVLARVLRNLARSMQETGATITSDVLPSVPIKAFHLEQLLQNLIGNALKYRKNEDPPCVHVSAEQLADRWHFAVRDNGIGIAPEYHALIFGVFKRLHSDRHEYSGTGMGLAICQRIVERYGGRIWVESEVGHGATFHFTLPLVALQM
jgi:signal transduction histidine kinase